MFKRILVANRGEIALRIIRCCRELNIESVLVYSSADKDSLAVVLAKESICIGPPNAGDSYLRQDLLIDLAGKMNCDAIHPGYGFLSENSDFAKKCEEQGITFIGPPWQIIQRMGDKQAARELMEQNHIPIISGSKECVESPEEAVEIADKIGYPVLIKATAGGGGKGMRLANSREEVAESFEMARREAAGAFGNDQVYIEKYIEDPRHIEVQIAADKYGNIIQLGERNCSIQRNHQKLVEEAPAWGLPEKVRQELGNSAVKAARAAGYNSVGTIEFLVDRNNQFYFIEMNTRIQVEHPVTEMVTGIDLVRLQIMIAAGKKLRIRQEDVHVNGHALEVRINARSCGKISCLHVPEGYGVRVESGLYNGCEITPFYDSMIAKIIVFGETRLDTIRRMRRCMEELIIDGIQTNSEEMYMLLYQSDFIRGCYDTSFWEQNRNAITEHARLLQNTGTQDRA